MNFMRVVHCKREKFDRYIGRNADPEKGKFGNPFSHKPDSMALIIVESVEKAMTYCRGWLKEGEPFLLSIGIAKDSDLFKTLMNKRKIILESLHELKGKTLGCWCKVKPTDFCHGDIYIELIGENERN